MRTQLQGRAVHLACPRRSRHGTKWCGRIGTLDKARTSVSTGQAGSPPYLLLNRSDQAVVALRLATSAATLQAIQKPDTLALHSMFDVRCSMFDVRCSMFDVRCSMFDVRRWMFDVPILHDSHAEPELGAPSSGRAGSPLPAAGKRTFPIRPPISRRTRSGAPYRPSCSSWMNSDWAGGDARPTTSPAHGSSGRYGC